MSLRRGVGAVLVLHCLGITDAAAQIVTDGSMGPAAALNGPNFQIGEALGTRLGSNLFHSFTDFNVQLNQSATFTSNFAGATSNVISRVTGGNASVINGLLSSEIVGADFWLINPNGLVFGANAQLDVPAGFHASTADVLKLGQGGEFRATNPNASSLTVADPIAFGFLDATIGSISVNGATLAVADGERMSFVGGVQNFADATLTAAGGRIDLVGAASAGEVSVAATPGNALLPTGMTAFADIDIGTTTLQAGTTSAIDGGTIGIVGDEVTLTQALLAARSDGAGAGGVVAIDAQELTMAGGSTINVGASASGDAGRVTVDAATKVLIFQSGDILANSIGVGAGAGSAGVIEITADSIIVGLGSTLSASTVDGSNTAPGGEPVGSRIDLRTNELLLDVFSDVQAQTTGAGQGGSISVTAFDPAQGFTIEILEGSSIQTVAMGTGNAGSIQLGSAAAPVDLIRFAPGQFQEVSGDGLFSDTRQNGPDGGDAGSIEIFARTLSMFGADISVESGILGVDNDNTGGDAGSIDLHIGSLDFRGRGASISGATYGTGDSGSITVTGEYSETPTIVMIDGVMTTRSRLSGNAGSIVIGSELSPFESIEVRDVFQSPLPNDFPQGFESTSLGTGDAGSIEINARILTLRDGAVISTSTVDGRGGEILLRVDELEVARFSQLTASSGGAGDAGDIEITGFGGEPASLVVLTGTNNSPGPQTGIFSNGFESGAAGDITVTATSVVVEEGASISADTRDGAGGTTTLQVGSLVLLNDGEISGSTSGTGDAGDIIISGVGGIGPASGVTLAIDSSILSLSQATGPGAGAAGNVEIHTGSLQLALNSGIIGNNFDGAGGTVTIRANTIDLFDSQISVIGLGQGDAGNISISGSGSAAAASRLGISGSETSGLFSSSNDSGADAGAAGSIIVNAVDIDLSDRGTINASTIDGVGGAIELQADHLRMTDASGVGAGTFGEGDGGQILVRGSSAAAAESVVITGSDEGRSSINTSAFPAEAGINPSGDGGDIQIVANSLELSDEASINSSTSTLGSGGTISLQVDELTIASAAAVTASTSESGNAGSIVVTGSDGGAASLVSLSGPGSGFATDSVSRDADGGLGGSIDIHADQMLLQDHSTISSSTAGGGAGGSIDLQVDDLQVLGGSVITASTLVLGLPDVSATGTGDAGSIVIHGTSNVVSTVLIDGVGSAVLSTSSLDRIDAGSSGDVTIQTGQLEITNQGAISVSTVGGAGGTIDIGVDALTVAGGAGIDALTSESGDAGDIDIHGVDGGRATSVALADEGSRISSASVGSGADAGVAGNINVSATSVTVSDAAIVSADTVDGLGGTIQMDVGQLTVSNDGVVTTNVSGAGTGGSIVVQADDLVLLVGGQIVARSLDEGSTAGSAGNISIAAAQLRLEPAEVGESAIDASTVDGAGGSIGLAVDSLTIEGSSIQASTSGSGDGGSIDVDASDTVLLDAGQLLADSSGSGASGSVSVDANELRLENGASISVRSTGAGRAGSVFTDVGSLFMSGNSQIDATATSSLAGNVELNVSEVAFLQDSIISGLSADPENDGGNFIIQHPEALVLQRSSILANSASGAGGNISITADAIVLDTESTVEATGQLLQTGEVLGSVLQLDPPVVVDAAAALDTSCTSQPAEERSSMIVRSTPPGAVREPYLPAGAPVASPPCRP